MNDERGKPDNKGPIEVFWHEELMGGLGRRRRF